jgi:predicted HTH transcriptional regulator
MIQIKSVADLELLKETIDLECKLAAGRDGRGALPGDFWPTYSAFANARGGVVILGVSEKDHKFRVEGIRDAERVRRELFNLLNNREKVSCNLLDDSNVKSSVIDGKTLLIIEIPRATRKDRPVHLTTNPMSGHTYRRLNDGDRQLSDEEVKRMLIACCLATISMTSARIRSGPIASFLPIETRNINGIAAMTQNFSDN